MCGVLNSLLVLEWRRRERGEEERAEGGRRGRERSAVREYVKSTELTALSLSLSHLSLPLSFSLSIFLSMYLSFSHKHVYVKGIFFRL